MNPEQVYININTMVDCKVLYPRKMTNKTKEVL